MASITLTGNQSVLSADFFPPIELKGDSYVCGLIDFQTFNSIPNIDIGCNKFYYIENKNVIKPIDNSEISGVLSHQISRDVEIVIPTGSYEIADIATYLQQQLLQNETNINLRVNKNTLRSEIKCSRDINFKYPDSIASILGFNYRVLEANKLHISDHPVDINRINVIRIECNITSGAYINNQPSHTIHEFFPAVEPGYKIIEVPRHVIYLPVTVKTIHSISVNIVDQNGQLINFRGETITIRIHIKKI